MISAGALAEEEEGRMQIPAKPGRTVSFVTRDPPV